MNPHERRAMVRQRDAFYEESKFELDCEDGKGVQWQRACSSNSVEEAVDLFLSKGYTIVQWQDEV